MRDKMKDENDVEVMLGDPKKAILSMTIPLIVSYLVSQINMFVDIAWCSGLGTDATSAVSAMSPIYWIIVSLGLGLGVGASATVSSYIGRQDKKKAESLAAQILVFTTLISLLITPILYLLIGPTISWMGADGIRGLCIEYCLPYIVMCLFLILNGVISGLLRSEGAAKRAMFILVLSAVINMFLDPVMIYGLGLGVSGAGWATVFATMISTMIGLYWYMNGYTFLKLSFKNFRFKWDELKEVLYVGIPRSAEGMIVNFMSLVQLVFVISCGGVIGAALYGIPWKFVSIGIIPATAMGAALIPVCSAALGKNNLKKAEKGYKYTLFTTTVVLTAIGAFIFVFADYLVVPFTYSESMASLRPEFAKILRIYSLFIPFFGFIEIGSALLQSIRKSHLSLACSLLRNILIVTLLYFASKISMDAIYWSLFISEIIGGIMMISLANYEFKKYKKSKESTRTLSL